MAEHDLSGAVLDGRYQVIEPIAEGAMGSVYRGERLKLGKAVAIKIMHDALPDELASRQRFEREAKLMARLEHPHVVSVIDFGLHDDKPFLVMDLVRGTSLQQLLDKIRRLEPPRAVDLVRQVLSGLGHAHELGIVHRDIKPANIMLTEKTGLGEQVRILDFGLARPASETTKLTTGIVVGTPNYMAPEQIKGGDIDGRADLYAVGVVLFELLTGDKPFSADDPIAVVRKHLNQPPPTLAAVAPGIAFGDLELVVARALAKSPNDRFKTAAEMSAALEKASNKSGARRTSELMGRAVPQTKPPSAPQVATASGWEVPSDPSTAMSNAGRASVPTPMSTVGSAPTSMGPHGAPASAMPNVGSAPTSMGPHGAPASAMPNVGSAPTGAPASAMSNVGSAPTGPHGAPASAMSNVGSAPTGPHGAPASAMANVGSAPTGPHGASTTIGSAPGPHGASTTIGSAPGPYGASPMTNVGSAPGPRASSQVSAPFAHIDSDPESGRVPTYPVVARAPSSPDRASSSASGPVSGSVVRSDGEGVSGPTSGVPSTDDSQARTSIAMSTIPPTRGRAGVDRPIPQIPLTRRQLMVAGGGLVLLVIIIIAAARGGGAQAKTVTDAAVAQLHNDAASDPVAPALARASDLYSNGELESALDVVAKARRQHPDSAQLAFLAGKIYFAKLWWTDGIKGFRDAIRLDAAYRTDPELAKLVLRGFLTTPDTDSRIEEFLRQDLGETVRPLLEETASEHPNAALRARAAAELKRFK